MGGVQVRVKQFGYLAVERYGTEIADSLFKRQLICVTWLLIFIRDLRLTTTPTCYTAAGAATVPHRPNRKMLSDRIGPL